MALCEQCGSVRIARADKHTAADMVVALLTNRRPFICRRCGWRARRSWKDRDLKTEITYGLGGAGPDPNLVVLDEELTRRRSTEHAPFFEGAAAKDRPDEVDLAALDHAKSPHTPSVTSATASAAPATDSFPHRRRATSRHHRRGRRREIIAAVALTTLTMFVVTMLGMTGSCVNRTPDF